MKKSLLLAVSLLTIFSCLGQTKKRKRPIPPPAVTIEEVKKDSSRTTVSNQIMPPIHPGAAPSLPSRNTNNQYSNNQIFTEYDMVTGEQFKPLESVALDKNAILIYDYDGSIKSFNLDTNTINWTFAAKDAAVSYSRNKFTLENGVLYVPFINGELYALNHKTGEKFWELKAGLKNSQYFKIWINQIPTINNDLLYITTQYENSNVYAFDKKTGNVVWNYKLSYPYNHLPLLYTNGKIITQNAPYVYSFDAKTGKLLAQRDFKKAMYAKPISDGERVYIANESQTLYALNPETLETIWELDLGEGSVEQKIFTKEGNVYLATDASFFAIEAKTGKIVWQTKSTVDKYDDIEQLQEYNNTMYAYTKKGTLFQVNLKNGKIDQSFVLQNRPISNIEMQDKNTAFFYCEAGLIKLNLKDKKEELVYMRNSINSDARENYIKLVR
ncbi:MAG: PQQ-binding-like beta-propeller repeat protein [Flavobacteriaceae bacterium]|jgi:outer membrane protein assembly factor BamB|nr:PQQ-binding-like beta-propeller repeat protein [Flavobacteriaceae bacterium]